MKRKIKRFIIQNGTKICAFVAAVASIAPRTCRNQWYQPDEPEGIEEFFAKKRNESY